MSCSVELGEKIDASRRRTSSQYIALQAVFSEPSICHRVLLILEAVIVDVTIMVRIELVAADKMPRIRRVEQLNCVMLLLYKPINR